MELRRNALALWRGPPLADVVLEGQARHEVGRLSELHMRTQVELLEAELDLGRHSQLVGELELLVAAYPYQERLRGLLMLALYRSGRQAEALEAYQDARRVLSEELGLEPGEALRELETAHPPAGRRAVEPERTRGSPPAAHRLRLPARSRSVSCVPSRLCSPTSWARARFPSGCHPTSSGSSSADA